MGEVFAVPYARLQPWPAALATQVAAAGFTVLALTPAPDAVPIQDLSADARRRPALLLGAEGTGLSAAAMASATRVVIPMRRGVDSLNVAAAAAVAFWELVR
jgi:tRNA G18 (ribose-2'-O)-methylase SpoU